MIHRRRRRSASGIDGRRTRRKKHAAPLFVSEPVPEDSLAPQRRASTEGHTPTQSGFGDRALAAHHPEGRRE